MSSSQFPAIVGLTPSAEAAMQNSGAQSQPGTLSQPNIFSSASIFSPSLSENVVGEYSTQDFSPLLSQEPPVSKRTKNWINDALDQAGSKVEIFLFQAIKAALIGFAEIPTSSEGAKQRLADILILVTKALQDARTVRIQGRFGFRAATLMSTDASTGILTERQELILREARQEAKLKGGFQRPAFPLTRVQPSAREQPDTLKRRFSYFLPRTNPRCTAPVHTYYEEGDSGNKKEMGCQSHCLFGRPSFSVSRSANLEEHNTGDNRIFGKPRSADKQEEVQPHTEFAVPFFGIRMEHNQLRCLSHGGEKKGSARVVSQVGEKVHKSQDCQSEGLNIIRRKAQFYTLRSARRIFAPPINLQIVAERSFNKRMGWNDEAECFNPPADKKKEMDIEEEHQAQTKSKSRISQLQLRSGNSAVVFNVNRWNAGRNLRPTLKRIWTLKEKLKIVLKAVHLPGLQNTRADDLPRLERAGDYSITDEDLSQILEVLHVTPTLDTFAAQHNHKVER
ncbi:uncharacterized protein MONOS_13288 [Monocercomonoides exilis]|uniref:uncharacterized protein n=1 Tax=Monocercomonoides exilis TaxID=2049356 RepID=UPI00355AB97F|nr:hypothetical protein MONOS_13288 [Monocercomonoides exilis]|eukprot:MONOS_13288.1-p1 / transcript=MONOS_13288.1 / gene=MONOS_13288 / organism=Monocercomonoides_exilis_PA203 / gene_product=unspecified product / transcript_product=unspecified product / location=Mono_scaffold00804:11757-14289(+) / protein_length=507 / sequence_SO=supercontig / SO=protein_coding / is_pseudo=false